MASPFFSKQSILFLTIVSGLVSVTTHAQKIELSGKIISSGELEGIHVINKTSYRYTTTDQNGLFIIEGKISDSLYFSSIQYMPKTIVLTAQQIKSKSITVSLSESINALDEVMVGTILTGNLNSDITNSDAERPIDFLRFGYPRLYRPPNELSRKTTF